MLSYEFAFRNVSVIGRAQMHVAVRVPLYLNRPGGFPHRYAREALSRATLPGSTMPSLGAWLRIVSAMYDGARCA